MRVKTNEISFVDESNTVTSDSTSAKAPSKDDDEIRIPSLTDSLGLIA